MIAQVTRRMNCFQPPIVTLQGLAILQHMIGYECMVDTFAAIGQAGSRQSVHDLAAAGLRRSKGPDRRAGAL